MFVKDPELSLKGGLSIGVPGEMACYAYAHDHYGRAEWADLIGVVVDLIENNVILTPTQSSALATHVGEINNNESLINPDGLVKSGGDQFKNQKLADTFKIIAKDKWAFYNGNNF